MLEQSYYDKVDEILEYNGCKPASLIPIMQDIQEEFRYLPGELLTYVASKIGITKAKAYSVATFYEKYTRKLCKKCVRLTQNKKSPLFCFPCSDFTAHFSQQQGDFHFLSTAADAASTAQITDQIGKTKLHTKTASGFHRHAAILCLSSGIPAVTAF